MDWQPKAAHRNTRIAYTKQATATNRETHANHQNVAFVSLPSSLKPQNWQ